MKVLLAVDDSKCSNLALESVCQRSWNKETDFRLVTVLEPLHTEYGIGAGYVWDSMLDAQNQARQDCQTFLDKSAHQIQTQFSEEQVSKVLVLGNTAESILEEASRWNADLIVLGSHGRKGFQKFLLGSVAEKVASYASCSVEIVKDKSSGGKNEAKITGTGMSKDVR
jgi:nucleotide-binding universal stress UspA family protein